MPTEQITKVDRNACHTLCDKGKSRTTLWRLSSRMKNPDIPWSDMAGMRDVQIHDYIDVDLGVVWKTA